MIRLVSSVYFVHISPAFSFVNRNLWCVSNVHFLPYEWYHNVRVWLMGGISEEGVLWLENQMKAENCKILLIIHNCWRLFWYSTYHEKHRLQLQLRSGFCKLSLCCKMNVRVKLKVKWHWYGEKLAKLCKRKLDFVVTLDDVLVWIMLPLLLKQRRVQICVISLDWKTWGHLVMSWH